MTIHVPLYKKELSKLFWEEDDFCLCDLPLPVSIIFLYRLCSWSQRCNFTEIVFLALHQMCHETCYKRNVSVISSCCKQQSKVNKDSKFWESKWFSKLLTWNDAMFDKDYLYFTNELVSFIVFMKTSTSSRYQWSVLDFLLHLAALWISCGHKWFLTVRKEVNESPASAFTEAVLFRQLQRAWKTESRWVHKKSLLGREQHKTALQTHSFKITI